MELVEMKKILKECVRKGGRYAENLKKDGNIWLLNLLIKNEGEEYEKLIDEAETFEELMIIWGFINLVRGFRMKNEEKGEDLIYIG